MDKVSAGLENGDEQCASAHGQHVASWHRSRDHASYKICDDRSSTWPHQSILLTSLPAAIGRKLPFRHKKWRRMRAINPPHGNKGACRATAGGSSCRESRGQCALASRGVPLGAQRRRRRDRHSSLLVSPLPLIWALLAPARLRRFLPGCLERGVAVTSARRQSPRQTRVREHSQTQGRAAAGLREVWKNRHTAAVHIVSTSGGIGVGTGAALRWPCVCRRALREGSIVDAFLLARAHVSCSLEKQKNWCIPASDQAKPGGGKMWHCSTSHTSAAHIKKGGMRKKRGKARV